MVFSPFGTAMIERNVDIMNSNMPVLNSFLNTPHNNNMDVYMAQFKVRTAIKTILSLNNKPLTKSVSFSKI